MSIFHRRKTPPPAELLNLDHQKAVLNDHFDAHAEFVRRAKEAEPAAMARADEIMSRLQAADERDAAAYNFDCKRFGDFLTVFMVRNGRVSTGRILPVRFSASINLGRTDRISLVAGRPPDRDGRLHYLPTIKTVEGSSCSYGYAIGNLPVPSAGQVRAVEPCFPEDDGDRLCTRTGTASPRGAADPFWGDRQIQYASAPFPRAARDDAIVFDGADTVILAPAGLGQSVLNKIMAEIAANAPAASVVE